MPLIQWIMQNLQIPKKNQGVIVGGTASVFQEFFIKEPAKVLVNGTAVISTARINRKSIRFNIGDTVFDSCNKAYVVISFEFDTLNQPVYTVVNNGFEKQIGERDLFDFQDVLNNLSSLAVTGEENVECLPGGYPVFLSQIQVSETDFIPNKELISLSAVAESKINELENKPLDNLPVYPGRRRREE
jgi:hypothetical protein